MKSIIDRGSLTALILTNQATTGFPVGDAIAPEHTSTPGQQPGWNGEPAAPGSFYVPYIVVTPATATTSSGSFPDPQEIWQLPYSLAYFGISREQVEAMANVSRKALRAMQSTKPVLDGDKYAIQQVWFSSLGGVGRIDTTLPSTWGEVDTITFWLSQ